MKSRRAKVLHPVGGLSMLEHVTRAARRVSEDVHVVVGHEADTVREAVSGVDFVTQEPQLGTGHAVMCARPAIGADAGGLLILPGDVPLISPDTLTSFADFHARGGYAGSVLTARVDDADGYGRIVRRGEHEIERIVEHVDADEAERAISEINSAIWIFQTPVLFDALDRVSRDNAQGEYYLTDVVEILTSNGGRVGAFRIEDPLDVTGVNSRADLARVDAIVRRRKCEALMASGVSILDPATAWIDEDVTIGPDSTIHPSVAIEGTSVLGGEVTVRSFSRITNSRIGDRSRILEGCIVVDSEIRHDVQAGPYAHLRMGVVLEDRVKVGNFVEIKKSRLGRGTKSMHLTYLGDADIGEEANIGAGTITCNYDGVRKNPTVIEDGAFIGSDSQLIAPVRIGKGSYVAAGSSITDDVPADSLAIARGRQVVKEGWTGRRKKDG